ncbi:hypothetical protein PsorP6_014256 [Peronosclerospora sorghi]|uniref:Uncharacterized protein n=1 Tax=Peronosclerospora sorghi TaxID=230839 RepID=A0ACC0VIC9_9STRA|nr:hypothetical protein PsorP6_014256 [Peronosclerospora sorghi]
MGNRKKQRLESEEAEDGQEEKRNHLYYVPINTVLQYNLVLDYVALGFHLASSSHYTTYKGKARTCKYRKSEQSKSGSTHSGCCGPEPDDTIRDYEFGWALTLALVSLTH